MMRAIIAHVNKSQAFFLHVHNGAERLSVFNSGLTLPCLLLLGGADGYNASADATLCNERSP
ncbi:hypothetical protein D3C78_1809490 [compost metagenome]